MQVASKICGITRVEDALAAVNAGVSAIGLVFYSPSPRAVTIAQARAIVAAVPPFVSVVGLFVNASRCEINETLDAVALDRLQFHGDETPEQCMGYPRPWYKALRVRPEMDVQLEARAYAAAGARAILLDAYVPGLPGGTGLSFDWSLIPSQLPLPLILAGGLDADNVVQAIQQVRPYAVDVSGGVEQAKGIKDLQRMQKFMSAVRRACDPVPQRIVQ